jgi:hypothetical protein
MWPDRFAEMVKKKKNSHLTDTFVWKATGPGSDTPTMRGLQEIAATKNYQWFYEDFMECAIPSAEWKLQSRRKRLSEYVTTTLEAFAIVVYYNSFDVWNQRSSVETSAETASNEGNDDVSTLTAVTKCTFRFHGGLKRVKKIRGMEQCWSGIFQRVAKLGGKTKKHS